MSLTLPDELNVARFEGPLTQEALAARIEQQERNKAIIYDFYDKGLRNRDFEYLKPHLAETYIQHNPTLGDGHEALRGFVERLKVTRVNSTYEIKRLIAEGDYVIIHSKVGFFPEGPFLAVIDLFRFEGDKVAEHWDVIQPVPEAPRNQNSMF